MMKTSLNFVLFKKKKKSYQANFYAFFYQQVKAIWDHGAHLQC